MPTFNLIPVAALLPPHNPQRQETLYERIEELRADLAQNGLLQPIGVQEEGAEYRIIWGHRRAIAATQLQWPTIPAMVYESSEPLDHDKAMGAENYHRKDVNLAEEARYYDRIWAKYPEGTIGMARDLNVPRDRIESLMACLRGDPQVFGLMAEGKLSLAQAVAINKFEHPGYKLQAIERATVEGASAQTIDGWRKQLKRQGVFEMEPGAQTLWNQEIDTTPRIPMDQCNIGNHEVPLMERKVYAICHEHWNIIIQGLEALGKQRVIEEAGYLPDFVRLLRKAENPDGR